MRGRETEERKGICLPRNPKGLKAFVNQRAKRRGHILTELGCPQEGRDSTTHTQPWLGAGTGGTANSRGKILNEEEEEEDSSLMEGAGQEAPAAPEQQQQFSLGLGSLGRILAQN